jgi:hypothetical protein
MYANSMRSDPHHIQSAVKMLSFQAGVPAAAAAAATPRRPLAAAFPSQPSHWHQQHQQQQQQPPQQYLSTVPPPPSLLLLDEEIRIQQQVQQLAVKKRQQLVPGHIDPTTMYRMLNSAAPRHLRRMVRDLKSRFDVLRTMRRPDFPDISDVKMTQLPYFLHSNHTVKISVLVLNVLQYEMMPLWCMYMALFFDAHAAHSLTVVDGEMINQEMDAILKRILSDLPARTADQPTAAAAAAADAGQQCESELDTLGCLWDDDGLDGRDGLGGGHDEWESSRAPVASTASTDADEASDGTSCEASDSSAHSAHTSPECTPQRDGTLSLSDSTFSLFSHPL